LNFSPKMQTQIQGFVGRELNWRIWDGVEADVWEVDCSAVAHGYYVSPDPRLFVTLSMTPGGAFEIGETLEGDLARHESAGSMSFIPANVPIEGRAVGLRHIRHMDIHFSEAAMTRRFGRSLDRERMKKTRLQFFDPEMARLASMIAAECCSDDPFHHHFSEGLVNALLARLFDVRQDRRRRRPGLSRAQLKLVTAYMEDHCFEPIRVGDLAALIKLSETHFSHAFKSSTGLPPHRWQMQARIRSVQAWLHEGDLTITQIASAAGFADQAHFARVFKMFVGLTPTEWRRSGRRPAL